MTVDETANELVSVVEETAVWMKSLHEPLVRVRPAPGKWSIQEILGHLVDSAGNNIQRFVRAPKTDVFVFPGYEQDHWVAAQGYNEVDWHELVELWRLLNRHAARAMRRVPADKLATKCVIAANEPDTLGYVIEDYLAHLKHHLRQIRERAE